MRISWGLLVVIVSHLSFADLVHAGGIKPGDTIAPDNAALVADLVSPGNLALVNQGMRMRIGPTGRLEWPPPYKEATEKYSAQVGLNSNGELKNYIAGLPFPLIDPNDPQAATKVMWNFSFRPQGTDDSEIREVELASFSGASDEPVEHFLIGHVSFYSNIGRTEVPPVPTDPDGIGPGIRYRFGAFPFEDPPEIWGFGMVRYRYIDPSREDNTWAYMPGTRHVRFVPAHILSDVAPPTSKISGSGGARAGGASFVNNIDADSTAGFAAKIEDFDYRLLGVKPMLASVHGEAIPAIPCRFDKNRTICPETWELRQLYIVEANVKPLSWTQKIGTDGLTIPRRIFYIDSEGWFITASDQYDREGTLWKTLAIFNAYRDRATPDAQVAIFPFKRIFQTGFVDEDLQSGYSTVAYTPGHESTDRDSWYINMGVVTKSILDPNRMAIVGDR